MLARSTSPDAYVVFYSYPEEDTSRISRKIPNADTNDFIVRRDIISINTEKPKTGVGNFSITLAGSVNYKTKIHPGTWCLIYMSDQRLSGDEKSGLNDGLKMIGVVRSVRTIETVDASGRKSVQYAVTGQDFHHVFNTNIYLSPALAAADGGTMSQAYLLLGDAFKETTPLSPDQIVDKLVNSLLGEVMVQNGKTRVVPNNRAGLPFIVPSNLTKRILGEPAHQNLFAAFLHRAIQKNLIGKSNISPDLGSMFSAWSIFQVYAHTLLNEIYSDLLPVGGKLQPSLIHRSIPFSAPGNKWDQSTLSLLDNRPELGLYVSKEIEESEILSFNYGKSDMERFNFFMVYLAGTPQRPTSENAIISAAMANGGINSMGDVNSMARYGFKPFISTSDFLLNEKTDMTPTARTIVKEMWERAFLYENGTLSLIGSSRFIPVGSIVKLKDRGWLGHVESVSNAFSASGGYKSFRTSVVLNRLQLENGSPVASVDTPGQRGAWDRGLSTASLDSQMKGELK